MDRKKQRLLKAKGWRLGNAADFLALSPEETCYIEMKLALCRSLKAERLEQGTTQFELAELIGSSQSRVAKMEAGDPSVSVDLLLKALLSLGVSRKQLSRIIS